RIASSPVYGFFKAEVIHSPGDRTSARSMFAAFRAWASAHNDGQGTRMPSTRFHRQMIEILTRAGWRRSTEWGIPRIYEDVRCAPQVRSGDWRLLRQPAGPAVDGDSRQPS